MARPVKNYCDYFPHDRDMRNHKKIKALRNKFGIIGYAVWSMILEYLTGSDGNEFENSEMEFELMSGDFGVSVTEISDVVNYCLKLELLFDKNGFIHSPSLDENLSTVYEKRRQAKELSAKQQRKNGKFINNNIDTTVVSVTETPQSKVDNTKLEETKEFLSLPAEADKNILPPEEKKPEIDWKKAKRDILKSMIEPFVEKYGSKICNDFWYHWGQPHKRLKQLKWEGEKYFDVDARLRTFKTNELNKK